MSSPAACELEGAFDSWVGCAARSPYRVATSSLGTRTQPGRGRPASLPVAVSLPAAPWRRGLWLRVYLPAQRGAVPTFLVATATRRARLGARCAIACMPARSRPRRGPRLRVEVAWCDRRPSRTPPAPALTRTRPGPRVVRSGRAEWSRLLLSTAEGAERASERGLATRLSQAAGAEWPPAGGGAHAAAERNAQFSAAV